MTSQLTILLLLISCGCVFASDPTTRATGPVDDPAKGVQRWTIDTPFLGKPSTIEVLLPDKIEAGKAYRTLYVLPVEGRIGGPFGDGLAELKKIGAHNRYSLICVTMSFDSVPWYGAHATDLKKRHAEFILKDVLPLIESKYPASAKAEDRLLLGFSKSGWGAVSLLLRNPETFGKACAWDAPLMMTEKQLKWGSKEHFGTAEQAAPYVPTTLIKEKAELFSKGEPRMVIVGHDLYPKDTIAFHELLESLKVPHRFDNSLKAKHRWDSGWVEKAMELLMGEGKSE